MGFLDSWFGRPDVALLSKQDNVNGLVRALKYKKDSAIRKQAAEELGAKFDFQVTARIADLGVRMVGLQNVPPPDRRKFVAKNLADLLKNNPSKALTALSASLGDEDAGVRASAATAVGRMWCRPGMMQNSLGTLLRWIPPDELSRLERSVVAARSGSSFLKTLAHCLHDADDTVRRAAVEALQRTQERAAIPDLSVTAAKEPNPELRKAEEQAVAQLESVRQ